MIEQDKLKIFCGLGQQGASFCFVRVTPLRVGGVEVARYDQRSAICNEICISYRGGDINCLLRRATIYIQDEKARLSFSRRGEELDENFIASPLWGDVMDR